MLIRGAWNIVQFHGLLFLCHKDKYLLFRTFVNAMPRIIAILFIVFWGIIPCSGELRAQAGADFPKLYSSNISIFDVDAGLPVSCISGGLIDRGGRLWINPCFIQEEHQTINFYKFDGSQSSFIEWGGLSDRPKSQAVLSGFMPSGELFGYFRGTGTVFLFNPDTRKTRLLELDTASVQINFMGYSNSHGIILHALSPTNHLVYRFDRDGFRLLLSLSRLDASYPHYPYGERGSALLTQDEIWISNLDESASIVYEKPIVGRSTFIRFNIATGKTQQYTLRDLFQGIPPAPVHSDWNRVMLQDHKEQIILYLSGWKRYVRIDPINGNIQSIEPFPDMDAARQARHPKSVHFYSGIAKDSSGNMLFFAQYGESYKAVLIDKAGKRYDYAPVLNAARETSRFSTGTIHEILGRDFRRQVYMFITSGLAVVDLKLSDPIKIRLSRAGARAIAELSPGRYIVNTDGSNLLYTSTLGPVAIESAAQIYPTNCLVQKGQSPKVLIGATIARDSAGFLWMPYKQQLLRIREGTACTAFPVGKAFLKFAFLDKETAVIAAENHLFRYHIPTRRLSPLHTNLQSVHFNKVVNQIYIDPDSVIWVAALDGLHRLDLNTGTYRLIGRDEGFQDERMMCLEADTNGNLWIGTYGGGLHIYNTRTEVVSVIDQKKGLSNNIVVGILTDDAGTRWLSTYQGITLVSEKGDVLGRLYQEDGLSTNEFNRYSYLKSSTGALLFGSVKGVNIIQPEAVKAQLFGAEPVRISLSEISYFDAKSEKLIRRTHWPYSVEKVFLPAAQRSISLQFALSNLAQNDENNFAYKLEGAGVGYTNDWIYIGTNNKLNLQNLPAGKFRIIIKGCDYHGNWTAEPLIIPVEAAEFFYKKIWFIALCVSGIFALALAWMFQQERERRRLEKELAERTDEIMRTRDQLVVREKLASLGHLTAGIAHEIKKPLSIVNNFALDSAQLADRFLEELKMAQGGSDPERYRQIEQYMSEIKQNALDIKSSGITADRIVRSMMDHARQPSVQMQSLDLNQLLKETAHLAVSGFRTTNSDFAVALNETYDPAVREVYGSPLNLSRALLNILNNACYALYEKHRHNAQFKPVLQMKTLALYDQVEIRIRDNGIGIDPAIRKDIFAPFFTTKPTGQGNTGLGLSICYDIIVAEHRGQLDVESEPNIFTEFVLRIPLTANKAG
ncbi:MAG: hypothetical protein KDC61_12095 [Saprospiraceae bacterium]|nr:hypothetical protein [Saprospiraceae bacterium]